MNNQKCKCKESSDIFCESCQDKIGIKTEAPKWEKNWHTFVAKNHNKTIYVVSNLIKSFISLTIAEAKEEERQFILNILDGIDLADKEMKNEGGSTKAIRFALKNRIIN